MLAVSGATDVDEAAEAVSEEDDPDDEQPVAKAVSVRPMARYEAMRIAGLCQ